MWPSVGRLEFGANRVHTALTSIFRRKHVWRVYWMKLIQSLHARTVPWTFHVKSKKNHHVTLHVCFSNENETQTVKRYLKRLQNWGFQLMFLSNLSFSQALLNNIQSCIFNPLLTALEYSSLNHRYEIPHLCFFCCFMFFEARDRQKVIGLALRRLKWEGTYQHKRKPNSKNTDRKKLLKHK